MPANTTNYQESGLDLKNKYLGYNDYTYLPYALYDSELRDISSAGLWAVGNGVNGPLGQNNETSYSSPVQVGTLTTWIEVAGSVYSTAAIKSDGTLWTWGLNDNGELGNNNITPRSSPVQVGALTNWSKISGQKITGGGFCSIKTDGTLWAWGYNSNGQLGQGNITSYSSPVQVGALTNWSKIEGGDQYFMAIKTDGTLWGWGRNLGQLGQGNTTYYSSPVQVGALTTWSKISCGVDHVLAIKTDGTLWSCGGNGDGQLGQGNTTYYSSPVQVGTLTTWSDITANYSSSLAIKTDGTLWSWGDNSFGIGQEGGQLGQGNTTSYSSPVQVGTLTDWYKIYSGYMTSAIHVHAIKTNGTLWAWGGNTNGKLGLGNTTHYSSPVQVGALTTWAKVSSGYLHSLFIKG